MSDGHYVLGIDFGTDSVRTIVTDAGSGEEIAAAVTHYPRWREGLYCDAAANRFRQHPSDYTESLDRSVNEALDAAPAGTRQKVRGIGIDTTGSTPVAVDRDGVPLSLKKGFADNPNAMFVLWKDHTAVREAEEINAAARTWGGEDYTKYEGGVYSSEWFWSKILHVLREDTAVRKEAFSWVEHCDWITALLTGNTDPLTLKRSRCAAGHKAMWHASWGGLPPEAFLTAVDPLLAGLRDRLFTDTFTADVPAGTLSPEWAKRLGLCDTVVVCVGAFDAHLGAVGAQIEPYHLCKVMGTSTCDMLVAPMEEMEDTLVKGICGQVDGSILPGMLGMEAGQSAFGDIYAWFRDLLMWPVVHLFEGLDPADLDRIRHDIRKRIIPELAEQAKTIPPQASSLLALDWMNGRRTPDANQLLKGSITGLSLGSDAPRIFRALVESTAFGARMIVDRFSEEGVPIRGVIASGGVPKKSPFVMQIMADVLNTKIRVVRSEQAVALGSAMAAAAAAGIHRDMAAAQTAMGSGFETEYMPDPERADIYNGLYEGYKRLGSFIENEMT
ncbi:ribulokinase [bacterium]|nr:ribulokinase [bacterium]